MMGMEREGRAHFWMPREKVNEHRMGYKQNIGFKMLQNLFS